MGESDGWFVCRVGFVEVARALHLAVGHAAVGAFEDEWSAFGVIEVDQDLVTAASWLAAERDLRSLDALHLAAALVVTDGDLVFSTWDQRLHRAAGAEGLALAPEHLDD
jgi:predicted nucleic acid-binding protein